MSMQTAHQPFYHWSWLMGPRTPRSQACPATRPIRSHSAVPRSSWAPRGRGGGAGTRPPPSLAHLL